MGKLILSVDDDRDILDCLELILPAEGYSVVTSVDPENIRADIAEYNPDLILLDIQMGAYNGLEICKELKSLDDIRDIPILILSSDDRIFEAVGKYHADGIISKPFDISGLIAAIDNFLAAKIISLPRAS
ncbi:response regulator [Desertivirga arenae]|uniref:response regulator n=1 Tax=Desertivirga arenae TaxID=2810309 RepID=UPI001A963681|nr:response regulator [Pedobacter sp. SYSU D00823]